MFNIDLKFMDKQIPNEVHLFDGQILYFFFFFIWQALYINLQCNGRGEHMKYMYMYM